MPKKTPRTFKRASYIALATVKPKPMAPPIEAHVINFGYGGVAIYTKAFLEGLMEITLYLEDDKGKPVSETLWGKVAWKKKLGSLQAYGIEFGNLNPENHRITLSLMEDLLEK